MKFLLVCLLSFFSISESKDIVINNDFFELDHMGNLYVVDQSELIKYNSDGKLLYRFSDVSLGDISSIDVSDPLRILLFYKDFNQLIYLNNKLSKIGSAIDLYDFSDNETEQVCSSQKGGFWILNGIDKQAFYISNNGKLLGESILLGSFFEESEIVKITESNGDLFLLYDNKGILQLDQNGQFVRKLTIKDIQDFQIVGNSIYYQTQNGFYEYASANQEDPLIYSRKSSDKKTIRLLDKQIYISNEKSISIKKLSF
ncbi:hypothetical protein [Marinifilum caeruleilacunae]|uniref:DUF5050 domain-containing protein n=1 Tax=Marinifilum caeruleilacunae TaxID=2499076 RepID=A0ABX1WWP6_9BACT|nr:hypothetical protein [Marinifilum caeruleilacunae]NOU60536.1 hypothetical protein [Marinifilum caeruleilacunae]